MTNRKFSKNPSIKRAPCGSNIKYSFLTYKRVVTKYYYDVSKNKTLVFFISTKKEPSVDCYGERWVQGSNNEIMRAYTHT